MQTSSFNFHPLKLTPPRAPFSGKSSRCTKRLSANSVFAFKKDGHDKNNRTGRNGKMVDENMIVLRQRIKEIKAAEMNDHDQLPENWMDWEKRYYSDGGYDSDIVKAIGYLQRLLMNTRPSLALGVVAIFAFSVPTSAVVVLWRLMGVLISFVTCHIRLLL